MQNNISNLSIQPLLKLGEAAATGGESIGADIGLVLNKASVLRADYQAAADAVLAQRNAVAERVAKATVLETALATSRTWCFRAKDTIKPYLTDSHSSLWRPTGFVFNLRVPEDYPSLYSLVVSLQKWLAGHPEVKNENLRVNVTPVRAKELHEALKAANEDLEDHDDVIATTLDAQEKALEKLRSRLRGLCGELEQLIGPSDRRWRRFGLNIPAEPETPSQPQQVQVDNSTPGQLLTSCPPVAFAERYRFFIQRVGLAGEPTPVGSAVEPLFVIENLDAGRFNVFMSAVNFAGNEGPRSEAIVAEVTAKAA
jgi:hypothetical protein